MQSILLAFFAIISCVYATISDTTLQFTNGPKKGELISFDLIGMESPLEGKVFVENMKQKLSLSFKADSTLVQNSLLVGYPSENLEQTFIGTIGNDDKYTFDIDISSFAPILLNSAVVEDKPLLITLVTASESNPQDNLIKELFYIEFNKNLVAEIPKFENSNGKLGPKKEIYHVFNTPPKHASKFLATIFSMIILSSILGLIASFAYTGALKIDNLPSGLNLIRFIILTCLTVGFEFVFVKYYLGVSIFDTLLHAGFIFLPFLFLGTKFLRTFGNDI
ncbi:hypothetical protein TBLA_0B05630 [Henningerozyma blattae CBS 6284]|uniref:Ribophorin II C-terminal domain-containing protein n=1 Tax=Henningerozyma blattae (strain ATCC 34711 / CBS 6284 / DSM 70876 / NBRC 10599 / NRRL Y-10934 / UCD 77-7) TaxID=1071380 RepID=I2GZ38_HENB6|nr:hypothetical protein TBLA_0B05630 [Tetrapisispora blattae CBS 6284]CCH59390.1 hypothetical protein TBLA_0B05630 [Tetrapisispora blattae CBS 6284]